MLKNYLSLVKFSHTVFALPFALTGLTLGFRDGQAFDFFKIIYVVLCMVFARSAAMAFNRYADRNIDARNPRTAVREIPAGMISAKNALAFVWINSILFMVSAFMINRLCFYLSPVALAVVLGYSFTKRFTALCHLVLGLGLALAPVGAYLAVTERFTPYIILLGLVVLTWVSGFDIIYALQDEEFDRQNRLNSIPVLLGRVWALRFSVLLHLLTMLMLVYFGFLAGGGWSFWAGCFLFCGLLVYQHTLVRPDDLSKINLAFFTTNGIASVIFGVMAIGDFSGMSFSL